MSSAQLAEQRGAGLASTGSMTAPQRSAVNPPRRKRGIAVLRLVASLCVVALIAASASAQNPPVETASLARGPYATMHALLERTIFNVDVLTVRLTVDPMTQDTLRRIVQGHDYSPRRAEWVAQTVLKAEDALVEARFERNISVGDFMEEVRKQLSRAHEAGLISAAERHSSEKRLRQMLAVLSERGFEKHDELLYRVRPSSVRMLVRAAGDRVLLDRTIVEERAPRTVLASYLAPGVPLRGLLIESLFRKR